jgi:hypothetical protein
LLSSQFRGHNANEGSFTESTALVYVLRWAAGIGYYSPRMRHDVKKRNNDMPKTEDAGKDERRN